MKLNELRPAKGSVKTKKRIGRGEGSGDGKTSGKGQKGQKSRSGYSRKMHFEGGQIPLIRQLPKRGFKSRSKVEYAIINVGMLENVAEEVITPEVLVNLGMIKENLPLKVLGDGALTKNKEVHAHAFSKSAVAKIDEAKGKAVTL